MEDSEQNIEGTCENFVNALKLLTKQRKDGDSRVETSVTGLLEKPQQDHAWSAQEVHFRRHPRSRESGKLALGNKVVKPRFTAPGDVLREGADEHFAGTCGRCVAHLD